MTRKLSITTAVAVAALGIGAPAALANSAPAFNPLGSPSATAQPDELGSVNTYRDAHERGSGTALSGGGISSTLAGYQEAFERAAAYERARSSTVANYKKDVFERAAALGSARSSTVADYKDAFERSVPPRGTVPVSAPTSGTEIEWPQVGVGLGIGILLALGLGLIMRMVRVRPVTH